MMKYIRFISLMVLVVIIGTSCQGPSSHEDFVLKTHKDSISYIIGYDYGEGIAIKDLEMQEIHRNQLVSYVEMAAHSMVNQPS